MDFAIYVCFLQIDVAMEKLSTIIKRWKGISWASRGGSVCRYILLFLIVLLGQKFGNFLPLLPL